MSTTSKPSRVASINAKCRECIYDPQARGTWREQVADCASVSCPLHAVRPVPRSCMVGGSICPTALAAVRKKLAA